MELNLQRGVLRKRVLAPAESISIVVSNLLTLGVALWQDWPLAWLVWPFWLQSVAIGVFNVRRMRALRHFSTQGLLLNNAPVEENDAAKRRIALFFTMHYGLFHLIYFLFLAGMAQPPLADWGWLGLGALALVYSEWREYRKRVAADQVSVPHIGALMFLPYTRIVPIHLTILFGHLLGGGQRMVVLFGLLKTASDLMSARYDAAAAPATARRSTP